MEGKETGATVLWDKFLGLSAIGKLVCVAGIALIISSNVGIDGAIPHHAWRAVGGVVIIFCGSRLRKGSKGKTR